MDIDKLFKVLYTHHPALPLLYILKKLQVPKIPTGGNKRRMPDAPPPEVLKKMRFSPEGASTNTSRASPPHSTSTSKRVASVRDADDDDDGDVEGDVRAENFAPGNDADYFAEEDEEGRFFGGGLTNEQKEILNIFDNASANQVPDDVRIHAQSNVLYS
jgi:beta-catenin-like protein 1